MTLKITAYEALCNLGGSIEEIYQKAIIGNTKCFEDLKGILKENCVHMGLIKSDLPNINNDDFNIRCNRFLLKNIELLQNEITRILKKYPKDKIGIVAASTNTGVEEYEKSGKNIHFDLSNPALFIKEHLKLEGFYTTVSCACSSGLKGFSLACDLINNNVSDAVIVACTDAISKVPIYGFDSLGVLSDKTSTPFGKNREGINLGEASAIFIIEKNSKYGTEILGIGESSDIYHPTTPDPKGIEAINAINKALKNAKLEPDDIDYINAHGTGTISNDVMEANAIYNIFGDKVPVSSTKPCTGHCLGATAGIEIALCLKLIENFDGRLYPNISNKEYDEALPKINLVSKNKKYIKCDIVMCNSFGFGGANSIMIMGKKNGQ